jgi:putative peptidoglycan lipid II flippase
MRAAIITLIVNVAASVALMFPLKHNGLALANSLAAMVNVIILIIVLKKKIGVFLDHFFYMSTIKIILASLLMWGSILLVDFFMPWNTYANFKTRLIYLIVTIAVGATTYFISTYFLKSPEIHSVIRQMQKRFSR